MTTGLGASGHCKLLYTAWDFRACKPAYHSRQCNVQYVLTLLFLLMLRGGVVTSWLLHWTNLVQTLDITCCDLRQDTSLSQYISPSMYIFEFNAESNPAVNYIETHAGRSRNTTSCCIGNQDKFWPDGHLAHIENLVLHSITVICTINLFLKYYFQCRYYKIKNN